MKNIIDIIKDGLNSNDFLKNIEVDFSLILVSKNNEDILKVKNELISDNFEMALEQLLEGDVRGNQVGWYVENLRRRLNDKPIFVDEGGYWVYSNGLENGPDLYENVKLGFERFNRLSEKNGIRYLNDVFIKNITFLFQENQISTQGATFYPKKLIQLGIISEEKNFFQKVILDMIERIKFLKIEQKHIESILPYAVIQQNDVVIKAVECLYGDLEKNGNFLICSALYSTNQKMIEWLLPKLNNFEINCKWSGVGKKMHNPGDMLYDLATKFEISDILLDKIRQRQEILDLNGLVSKPIINSQVKSL